MESKQPIAFISHASEDKSRFVLPFANKLQEKGIYPWVDKWEILPGDSIIDKIFEDGIKNANVFIIILSNFSVGKPWVKEELNAGIIKRIEGQIKIIPIVLDNCEVPEALRTIRWVKINDIDNYVEEFNEIVASIFGITKIPHRGTFPKYVSQPSIFLPNLTHIDTIIFKRIYEMFIENGVPYLNPTRIGLEFKDQDISVTQIEESLEVLDSLGFIDGKKEVGTTGISYFRSSTLGFNLYSSNFIEDFENLKMKVLASIINMNLSSNNEISEFLSIPLPITNNILEFFERLQYLKLSKSYCEEVDIYDISVTAKRNVENYRPN